jgi:hypothetical protein
VSRHLVNPRDVWQRGEADVEATTKPFDGFVEHTKRASPTCLITFERTCYSVPASYDIRPVSRRV